MDIKILVWVDYTVEQGLYRLRGTGDWNTEVMGYDRDGKHGYKTRPLYSPGEVYIVGEDGWLRKVDDLSALIYKYRDKKG